tara:strand:- start:743 stop:2146 length:1404 start_codon:yes stop_codon:yes gene_type:complete
MRFVSFSILVMVISHSSFGQDSTTNQTRFGIDSLRFFTSKQSNLQLIFNKSVLNIFKDSLNLNKLKIKEPKGFDDINSKNYSIVKDLNGVNFFLRSNVGEVFFFENDSLIRKDFSQNSKAFYGTNLVYHQNSIFSFFGYGFFENRNSVIQFDFETREWNKIILKKDSYRPKARWNSIYHKKGDKVYFLGGTTQIGPDFPIHNFDMMTYDFTDQKFSKIGDIKNNITFFNTDPKYIFRIDDSKSLFFKKHVAYLVDFELLNYRTFTVFNNFNSYPNKVIIKDTLYYLNTLNKDEFDIKYIAITDLLNNFSEPKEFLEEVYISKKIKIYSSLLLCITLILFISIRLFRLRKFKNRYILKQDRYLTHKKTILTLTHEESQIINFLITKQRTQLHQLFELDAFREYSKSYLKIHVSKVIDQIKKKIENDYDNSDFDLKIIYGKSKYDKRIKEISLKGEIKIYNGWLRYILS